MDEFVCTSYSSEERAARREMCQLIKRAYDQQLFTQHPGYFFSAAFGRLFHHNCLMRRTENTWKKRTWCVFRGPGARRERSRPGL